VRRKSGHAKTGIGRAAVTEALRASIVGGLHVGRLSGGDRLPSARSLAADYGVNERVVLAALRSLADEGFLDLRTRSGAYVKPPHPAGDGKLPDLGAWLVTMLLQSRSRGLAPREVSHYLEAALKTRRVRAACIECNLDQLHLLCSELAADYGYETHGAELAEIDRSDEVARADVFVTTIFHAAEVRALGKKMRKPCIVVTLRSDATEEVGNALRRGPVYYVGTDSRFEPKLRKMLQAVGPTKNLRYVLIGRDDPEDIPPGATTYIMSSAREYLNQRYGPAGPPGHPIHPPRVFSDESARQLLTTLVRANRAALAAGLDSISD
jgi:DNA-binding transcriptional regulator YhcF (GntR family)